LARIVSALTRSAPDDSTVSRMRAGLPVIVHDDGKTPYPYWHILMRPAGSINASAQDMAAYVQFYLNRGMVNGAQVVPAADMSNWRLS
jgi:CubicO group peptidase (beta-lactamase class C family)